MGRQSTRPRETEFEVDKVEGSSGPQISGCAKSHSHGAKTSPGTGANVPPTGSSALDGFSVRVLAVARGALSLLAAAMVGLALAGWALAGSALALKGPVLALGNWVLEEGRWQEMENNPNCVVWNAFLPFDEVVWNAFSFSIETTVTWSGACADGKAQGPGTMVAQYMVDGERKRGRYEGQMKDGTRHGRGTIEWVSGSRYEGDWKDGHYNGHGVYVWGPDSKWAGDRYEGEFKDSKRHGRGVYVWGPDSKWAGDRYEGEWKDGDYSGRGVFVTAAGSRYEGEFKDNDRHGRGVYEFANGDRCEGDWREGRLLGRVKTWSKSQKRWGECYWDGDEVRFTEGERRDRRVVSNTAGSDGSRKADEKH